MQLSTLTDKERYNKRVQRRADATAEAIFLKTDAAHEAIIYAQLKAIIPECDR